MALFDTFLVPNYLFANQSFKFNFFSLSGEMTKDRQGTGLGDGQADEATTNDLESEDVFEGAEKPKRPDEEDEEKADEEEEKTKEEDGVELSGDLDAQMQVSQHDIHQTVHLIKIKLHLSYA